MKPGDVVQLKSGGPHMTVRTVDKDGMVVCDWFAGAQMQSGIFPATSLEIV